jgi:hypothetical protein
MSSSPAATAACELLPSLLARTFHLALPFDRLFCLHIMKVLSASDALLCSYMFLDEDHSLLHFIRFQVRVQGFF